MILWSPVSETQSPIQRSRCDDIGLLQKWDTSRLIGDGIEVRRLYSRSVQSIAALEYLRQIVEFTWCKKSSSTIDLTIVPA